jgi:hypothetical protein
MRRRRKEEKKERGRRVGGYHIYIKRKEEAEPFGNRLSVS